MAQLDVKLTRSSPLFFRVAPTRRPLRCLRFKAARIVASPAPSSSRIVSSSPTLRNRTHAPLRHVCPPS